MHKSNEEKQTLHLPSHNFVADSCFPDFVRFNKDVLFGDIRDVGLAPNQEDHGGDEHEDGWQPECKGITLIVTEAGNVCAELGREQAGNQGSGIDCEIEGREIALDQVWFLR